MKKKKRISAKRQKNITQNLNIAFEHHQTGRLLEAENIYRKILKVDPRNPDANNLLSVILHDKHKYKTAASLALKAVNRDPGRANYHCSYGKALKGLGRLDEAVREFKLTLELRPAYNEAAFELADCYYFQGNYSESKRRFDEIIGRQPTLPEVQTHLAIQAWMRGDWAACKKHYELLAGASEHEITNSRFVVPYRVLLEELISFRQQRPEYYEKNDGLPTLYVIGDSQSLAPAHMKILYKGKPHRIEAKVVIGCKAWHLANKEKNRFKNLFEKIVADLPSGANVLLMFGQIDCGLDEGIIRVYKNRDIGIAQIVDELAAGYIGYIYDILKKNDTCPIVCGVPMMSEGYVPDDDKKIMAAIVELLNMAFTASAKEVGLPAINLYTSAPRLIDSVHVHPEAFENLLGAASACANNEQEAR